MTKKSRSSISHTDEKERPSKSATDNKAAPTIAAREDLERKEYFHGYRPRKDILHLLKEPNQFLVRISDSAGETVGELIISVLNEKKELLNLTLDPGPFWQFFLTRRAQKAKKKKSVKTEDVTYKGMDKPNMGFPSVAALIEHYKDHKTPGKAYLKYPILRPKWLITHDMVEYKQADLVGRGNFCNVYRGKYHRTAGTTYDVAVKVCHEGRLSETTDESKETRKAMIAEAERMSIYIDEFIIQLHGVALAHASILIVMEFCAGGNLEQHLKTCGEKIEAGERVAYALKASKGMIYLHEKECVHRDRSARNCLISSQGTVKISDFGLSLMANEVEQGTEEPEVNPQIPLRWMAPESLKQPMRFSKKSDVWSFAVLLYEVFNDGVKTWPDDLPKKIATQIRKCQMPAMPEKTPSSN